MRGPNVMLGYWQRPMDTEGALADGRAVVVIDDDAAVSPAELTAHACERIIGCELPRTVELRTEPLPKSGAGKVLRAVLREPFWTAKQRRVS